MRFLDQPYYIGRDRPPDTFGTRREDTHRVPSEWRPDAVLLAVFTEYLSPHEPAVAARGTPITRAAMTANLAAKRSHPLFRSDLSPLLAPSATFDVDQALDQVLTELVALLPGN